MIKLFLSFMLLSFLGSCFSAKKENYAFDAPVKKFVFELPFPADLLYQATPNKNVIIGKKLLEPAVYEIGGYETATGRRLWQLPFAGEIVGRTEKQILVFEEKTSTVYFITPQDGQITRKISPAPNPLASRNGLEQGMAFTDDVYLTTKSLYSTVYENAADWDHRREDNSFQIGITARKWSGGENIWFLPPVQQIITVEDRPVIFGDKVLIINPHYTADQPHTYQIVSLATGAEISRIQSPGYFHYLDDRYFIEQTNAFTRRLEPLTGRELWRIDYDVKNSFVSVTGSQVTVETNNGNSLRTIRIVDAETGKLLKQFEMPETGETSLKGCFIAKDGTLLMNFDSKVYDIYDKKHYNYWVAYDAEAKKVLWRTDFASHSATSLFPFASDQMQFKDAN